MKTVLCSVVILAVVAPVAHAVEMTVNPSGPVISENRVMGGIMVQIILGLFLAAAAIGPLVAILMPPIQEPPAQDNHSNHNGH